MAVELGIPRHRGAGSLERGSEFGQPVHDDPRMGLARRREVALDAEVHLKAAASEPATAPACQPGRLSQLGQAERRAPELSAGFLVTGGDGELDMVQSFDFERITPRHASIVPGLPLGDALVAW